MTRFCPQSWRSAFLVVAGCSYFLSTHAHAVITSWNTNSSGSFTSAANWDNGVPDSDDVAVFNRGFVAYEVGFPGGSIFDPPLNYPIDYLRVRTNEVSFVWSPVPFQRSPSLSVLNPDLSIVVGEDAGEVAILNMAISSLSGANASIGRAGGATGTLNVGGAFSLTGALNVGEFGTGTMSVTNGSTVASANGFIGANSGSNGQVTVSGANSQWINSNWLTVGDSGAGMLTVQNGGSVSDISGTIGLVAGSNGTAIVTGAGSTWTNSSGLSVGANGAGTLTIEAGGTVASGDGTVALEVASTGTVTVTGTGSTWTNSSDLTVGSFGQATLTIEAGGSVSNVTGTIGSQSGSKGTATVTGAGSTWTHSGDLTVGSFGRGTLNVTAGATVANTDGFIGIDAGFSDGQVTVSGANSTWAISNSLTVGGSNPNIFNGRLDVNDGGVVSVMDVLQVNRGGRLAGNGLIQGNVENSGTVAPGTFTSPGTLHIDGSFGQSALGRLNIGLAAADSVAKLDIDGNVTLGGRLHVSMLTGYSPEAGDTFDILDRTGMQNGVFEYIRLPELSAGRIWDTSQLYTSGVLSVAAGLPGQFQPGEFITASQDSWGNVSSDAGQLLLNEFDFRFPTGVEVGIPGFSGYSMAFTSAAALLDYLPASGVYGSLNANLLDPTSSASGAYGGYVSALQLIVDFNDSGDLTGTSSVLFGDLVLHDLGLTAFIGLTVRQYLAEANSFLGGGPWPYDIDDFAPLTEALTLAFEGGIPTQWAQDHLRIVIPGDFNQDGAVDAADYVVWRKNDGMPAGYSEWRANFGWTAGSASGGAAGGAVPEPATAILLALAIGSLHVARRNRKQGGAILTPPDRSARRNLGGSPSCCVSTLVLRAAS